MDAETVSAIAAVAAAVIAIGAAYLSKRSADKSAAAEERSARAAERSAAVAERGLAIDEKRFESEREREAEERAPRVDIGEQHGLRWTLARQGRVLVGYVENHGPTAALVEGVSLEGPNGVVEGTFVQSQELPALVEAGSSPQVAIDWPFGSDVPHGALTITVRYGSASRNYRASAQFTLHRAGGDPNGQPLWKTAGGRVRRLG